MENIYAYSPSVQHFVLIAQNIDRALGIEQPVVDKYTFNVSAGCFIHHEEDYLAR